MWFIKFLLKSLLVQVLIFQIILLPAGHASFFNAKSARIFNKFSEQTKMQVQRINYGMGKRALEITFLGLGAKNPKMLIEETAPEVLKNFPIWASIKEYSKSMTSYAESVKDFAMVNGTKGALIAAKEAAKKKLIKFPQEAMMFFIGLGALNYLQMLQAPEMDPLILQRHIDAQYNPVGQIGFASFMMASGMSEHFLMEPIRAQADFFEKTKSLKAAGYSVGKLKPTYLKFASKVPFFGMTMGSIASNIVHEIFGPYVENAKCSVNPELSEEIRKHCLEELWSVSHLSKVFSIDNMVKWSPSLLSMLGSTYLSGFISVTMGIAQQSLPMLLELAPKAMATLGENQIIKISTVALELGARGAIKGLSVVFSIANPIMNIVMFTGLDQLILPLFEIPISNAFRSQWTHRRINNELEDLLTAIRKNKEFSIEETKNEKKIKELEILNKFSDITQDWKNYNLSDILQAHAAWEELLNMLTSTYRASTKFYDQFLENYHHRKNVEKGKSKANFSSIDLAFPLMGVFDEEKKFSVGEAYQHGQVYSLSQKTYLKSILPELAGIQERLTQLNLNTYDIAFFNELISVIEKLSLETTQTFIKPNNDSALQPDLKMFADFIERMNLILDIPYELLFSESFPRNKFNPNKIYEEQRNLSEPFKFILKEIRKNLIGNVKPIQHKGRGYFILHDNIEEYAKMNNSAKNHYFNYAFWNKKLMDRYFHIPSFANYNLGDYMLLGMFFGANVESGEKVVSEINGFPAIFIPPQIIKDSLKDFQYIGILEGKNNDLTTTELILRKNGESKKYKSFYDYIVDPTEINLSESYFNMDHSKVVEYWQNQIESQYLDTWNRYEEMYQGIVSRLVERLQGKYDNPLPKLGYLQGLKYFWDKNVNTLVRNAFTNDAGDIKANAGYLANNVMETSDQEVKVYLMVLSELANKLNQNKKANFVVSKNKRTFVNNSDASENVNDNNSLLSNLRNNQIFNYSNLKQQITSNNFQFIDDLYLEIQKIYLHVYKIKTIAVKGLANERLETNLDLKKFSEVQKNLKLNIAAIGTLFGISLEDSNCEKLFGNNKEAQDLKLLEKTKNWQLQKSELSETDKQFVKGVLGLLIKNVDNVSQLITIANAVSYKANHDTDLKKIKDELEEKTNDNKVKPKSIGLPGGGH